MGVMHPCHYPGCMKKFDRKYNLKCHLRIHSNEKPYRCHHENCTRSFRWKSSLNHHLMSLDHTPAAVRRARKARAQRRRIVTSPSPTFLSPQQSLDHQEVFDLPALSPVSSVATYSHSPSPQSRTLPDISHPQQLHFKLNHRLTQSHITPSSVPQQLHFINSNPAPNPNQPSLYSHSPAHYRPLPPPPPPPPTHVLRSPPTLPPQSEPPQKSQPQQTIITHLQDPLTIPVKPLQHPLIPDPNFKTELRTFAEDSSHPRCTSDPETSPATLADDTISLVTPTKKSEPFDFTSSTKPSVPQPLVSIFEEYSPVSLMPFSSSLDSLFPASVDTSGLKSF